MKKFLKILAVILVLLPLAALGYLTWSTQQRLAVPAGEALAALEDTSEVSVEAGDWLVMRPANGEPAGGLILYPGANCDIRGYAPLLREIAAGGWLVVAVSMPFDFAIFAPDRADAVRAAYPDIRQWVIAGHSMGGAMAARYADHHEDELAGLILWDSYPPEGNSLAGSSLPVLHIHRATPDGRPPAKFEKMRHLFPASSDWVPVPGGLHMYFGSFIGGGYVEEWEARIGRDAQQEIIVDATLEALASMTGNDGA